MNLLILQSTNAFANSRIEIDGYQHLHLKKILKVKPGDRIKVGKLNGNTGIAQVINCFDQSTLIEILHLDIPPPPLLPLSIILALPRPQMIKRIFQTIATMGVQQLVLIQSSRVEKSFWQSPALADAEILRQLILGLEQGMATQVPQVARHEKFFPFMENQLSGYIKGARCFIAEPGNHKPLKLLNVADSNISTPAVFAVGPEGGFSKNEVGLFVDNNFAPVQLGERVLKVETVIPVIAAAFL